jgi:hypothetical protein
MAAKGAEELRILDFGLRIEFFRIRNPKSAVRNLQSQ